MKKEHSFKFLVLRAVAVLLIVAAVLVGLRLAGLTGGEQNLSPEAVEEIARSRAQSVYPMGERP